jgi:hypothetical protein
MHMSTKSKSLSCWYGSSRAEHIPLHFADGQGHLMSILNWPKKDSIWQLISQHPVCDFEKIREVFGRKIQGEKGNEKLY